MGYTKCFDMCTKNNTRTKQEHNTKKPKPQQQKDP